MPTLDLTSSMMSMAQRHQEASGGLPAGESTSQLPRPREFIPAQHSLPTILVLFVAIYINLFHSNCFSIPFLSCNRWNT